MTAPPFPFTGLSTAEVEAARKAHGPNTLTAIAGGGFWSALRTAVTEPMFLLLLCAATLYFILGQEQEAWFMLGAILLITAISLYQDHRSRKALEALDRYAQPKARAIRGTTVTELPSEDLVVGDLVVVNEGELVPADGLVLQANDFAVNESILTGEAFSVPKQAGMGRASQVYGGTQAVGGLAVVRLTAVGGGTEIGRIGRSLAAQEGERSPLERRIHRFVRRMAVVGALFFLLVWGLNYMASRNVVESLLRGLTLAMSILPEEIPVAFTTFMALGAWRMMRLGVLVKQARTVETLGVATVICTDKTGTITENRMELVALHLQGEPRPRAPEQWTGREARHLLSMAMWASEPVPFDPMEVALHDAYARHVPQDMRSRFRMEHEYPMGGRPPMMTHIFADGTGERIIATKGAPEAVLACSGLDAAACNEVLGHVEAFAAAGHRVLAVGEASWPGGPWPAAQQQLPFRFLGLVAFHDPPKKNIKAVFEHFRRAGIRTVVITGDNAVTAMAIARQVQLHLAGDPVTGDTVEGLSDHELADVVRRNDLFVRMFPEAKLRVVNALKALGEVVAMTGDGVNDGPALKAAHIGIAMGRRGSELAKEAAALVLLDDDLGHMVEAVAQGRRIYSNLKKAIQYIISIHIPIILTVALPLLLGWSNPHIFTPVHVIFLELLMGPTCSIAYESEPIEPGSMRRRPRRVDHTFLSWTELRTSLLQGLMITLGTLFCHQWAVQHALGEELTRALVFTALVVANITLTLVNRSFEHSVLDTLRYPNPLLRGILGITMGLLLLLLYVPAPRDFFRLASPGVGLLAMASAIGMASVLWYEGVKAWQRRSAPEDAP